MKTERFNRWMQRVDTRVWLLAGLSLSDLPDCPFDAWYRAGLSPEQAARNTIRRARRN